MKKIGWLFLLFLSFSSAFATTYFVDPDSGDDGFDGLHASRPFQTINRACSLVGPGDKVVLAQGVYFESVRLDTVGTPSQPITFQGPRGRNNAIITGADRAFRNDWVDWKLVDSSLNLYAAPLAWLPARVLYNDTDLFPYSSLNGLKTFITEGVNPGPLHGFFYDTRANLLYVRFNPKYGSLKPGEKTMIVSPPNGGGPTGKVYQAQSDCNFLIHSFGSANVIFDGITFEAPGIAGIVSRASDVVVQNCYFVGCRTAFYGIGTNQTSAAINNITLQYNEYNVFPAFNDMVDELKTAYDRNLNLPASSFWWWQRKLIPYTYELGFVLGVGANWKIQHNYLHDCVDAISSWGTGASTNLDISYNVIARTCDNAVEIGKSHETNMYVHDNAMLDCFEAICYQPLAGQPWPHNLYVSHNVIADTEMHDDLWAHLPWERGALKVRFDNVPLTSVSLPDDGVVFSNNTLLQYNGITFNLGILGMHLSNVHLINNFIVSRYPFSRYVRTSPLLDFGGFDVQGNAVAPSDSTVPGPGPMIAGNRGQSFLSYADALLQDPFGFDFVPESKSPLLGRGLTNLAAAGVSSDIGADSMHSRPALPVYGIQPY